jgi:hypothetical protein
VRARITGVPTTQGDGENPQVPPGKPPQGGGGKAPTLSSHSACHSTARWKNLLRPCGALVHLQRHPDHHTSWQLALHCHIGAFPSASTSNSDGLVLLLPFARGQPRSAGGQRCRTAARSTRPHALRAPSAAHHALPVSSQSASPAWCTTHLASPHQPVKRILTHSRFMTGLPGSLVFGSAERPGKKAKRHERGLTDPIINVP